MNRSERFPARGRSELFRVEIAVCHPAVSRQSESPASLMHIDSIHFLLMHSNIEQNQLPLNYLFHLDMRRLSNLGDRNTVSTESPAEILESDRACHPYAPKWSKSKDWTRLR